MQFDLKKKILLLILVPFVIIFIMGAVFASGALHEVREAKQLIENGNSLAALSQFIHELQKERARSGLYLGKNITQLELNEVRGNTDKKMQQADAYLTTARLKSDSRSIWAQQKNALKTLRQEVESAGIDAGQSAQTYSDIIASLINVQLSLAREVSFQGNEDRLLSLAIFSTAKEAAGKLRAKGINILSANKPLTPIQVSDFNAQKLGVSINMRSPAMNFTAEGMKDIDAFEKSEDWKRVLTITNGIVEHADKGDYGYDPKEFYSAITTSIDVMMNFTNNENERFSVALQEDVKNISFRTYGLIILVSFTLLITLILVYKTTQSVVLDIGSATAALAEMAQDVRSASQQLSSSSQQLSTGATETAASLEETVASAEELTSIVKVTNQSAFLAATLSKEGAEKAEQGEKNTTELMRSMLDISESSRQIHDITNVIDDLAFQTNLLALNAAVEAARAGEQGKGFAVVAEAVRSLAQKSALAAKDINQLISESGVKIERGSKVASDSVDYLKLLLENVRKISQLNTEMSASSQEQESGFSQIAQAMNQVDSATQSNAAEAEQVSALSLKMSEQAENLAKIVSRLNLVVKGKRS